MMRVRVRQQYIGVTRQPVWTGVIAYVHPNGRAGWSTQTGRLRLDKQTAKDDALELLAHSQRLTPRPTAHEQSSPRRDYGHQETRSRA